MLTHEIAVGLFTNLLSQVLMTPLFRSDDVLPDSTDISAAMVSLIEGVSDQFVAEYGSEDPASDEWKLVLLSSEVRGATELLFGSCVDRSAVDLDDVRSVFSAGIHAVSKRLPAFGKVDAERLFEDLLRHATTLLDAAAREGCVGAADAKAELRHKMLLAEVKLLDGILRQERESITDDALSGYVERLRVEVLARTSRIDLPSTVRHEPVDIDALYVVPQLAMASTEPTPTTAWRPHAAPFAPTTYERFVRSSRRRVVLGNPGAGKSTLAAKLCYDLARGVDGLSVRGAVTPLKVELRKFHAQGEGIIPYCDRLIAEEYLLESPQGTFVEMLLRRRMLIVFDGLDEILDSGERRNVRTTIEGFCRQFPAIDVVVTSRVVGYDQAPLDSREFDITRIEDFDASRVREYATNWFAIDGPASPHETRSMVEAFLSESSSVGELRSNPLLLALLCALYRGQGFIPDNLPDVYEQCSLLLFQTWDKSRGIDPGLPFTRHVQPALEDMAYWIYSDPRLAAGVTERQAVDRATKYLNHWRFSSPGEARAAAREFVEFCRGRAWVFSDQQSTSSAGEDLFAFTHRTFLEYFTAMYIVSANNDIDELLGLLLPRIKAEEWDVVCRIALQAHASNKLGGADEVVKELSDAIDRTLIEERLPLFATLLSTIGPMVPSPDGIEPLSRTIIDTLADRRGMSVKGRRSLIELVASAGDEVLPTLAEQLVGHAAKLALSDGEDAAVGAELLRSFLTGQHRALTEAVRGHLADYRASLHEKALGDFTLARTMCGTAISPPEAVAAHGLGALIVRPSNVLRLDSRGQTIIEECVSVCIHGDRKPLMRLAEATGELWKSGTAPRHAVARVVASADVRWADALEALDPDDNFVRRLAAEDVLRIGLWTLLALSAETQTMRPSSIDAPEPVAELWSLGATRYGAKDPDGVALIFPDETSRAFVEAWRAGTVTLKAQGDRRRG
jgi:hypothetical protein